MRRLHPLHFIKRATRWLNPFHAGFASWFAGVTGLAALLAYLFRHVACPSADLMQALAQVGATLLVGWVVTAVWMAARLERDGDDREQWFGVAAGFGIGGLAGLTVAFLVAAHREAGHANYLDWLGCWWAVISVGALGLIVVLHPVIVERWTSDRLRLTESMRASGEGR